MLTIGKAIGGGVPVGAFGMTADAAERVLGIADVDLEDVGGVGGTLAGNPLSVAAVRATLSEVLTDDAWESTIPLAERFANGVETVVAEAGLPWHVTRLGCRAEYRFSPEPPRTGGESAALADPELEDFLHLYALNRGVLLTPFHNMALMCPATTEDDVDRHTAVLREAVAELV
jgi:glutamate-1-semialdehyde 2,1-aminomutase